LAAPRSSQKTFETIDESVKSILDSCYEQARSILIEKKLYVERVASELLEVETLSRERFIELMGSLVLNNDTGPLPVYSNVTLNPEA
jgi:ATP-dependent Zn protease